MSRSARIVKRTWLFDLDNTLHDASRAAFGPTNEAMTRYIAEHLARHGEVEVLCQHVGDRSDPRAPA